MFHSFFKRVQTTGLERKKLSFQEYCHNKQPPYACIPRSLSVGDNISRLNIYFPCSLFPSFCKGVAQQNTCYPCVIEGHISQFLKRLSRVERKAMYVYFLRSLSVLSKRNTREFTKPQRLRRGQRRLKNQSMVSLRILRYCKVINVVYYCQNYSKTKSGAQR